MLLGATVASPDLLVPEPLPIGLPKKPKMKKKASEGLCLHMFTLQLVRPLLLLNGSNLATLPCDDVFRIRLPHAPHMHRMHQGTGSACSRGSYSLRV